MAVNDVYRVTNRQSFLGVTLSNVYWYRMLSGNLVANYATQLAEEFDFVIVGNVRTLQSVDLQHVAVEVVNMRDPSDFAFIGPIGNGLIPDGDNVGVRTAFQYRLNRTGPGQRSGFKRYAGLRETQISGNNWAPIVGSVQTLALKLVEQIETADGVFAPVVVGTPREFGANPPVQYRPILAVPLLQLSTQVNRLKSTGQVLPSP